MTEVNKRQSIKINYSSELSEHGNIYTADVLS